MMMMMMMKREREMEMHSQTPVSRLPAEALGPSARAPRAAGCLLVATDQWRWI